MTRGQRPSAVVLGLYDTGVATARCLGRAGVAVEGYDADVGMPGFRSRYCRTAPCPNPTADPEGLLRFLRERADPAHPKVLYPASDDYVLFVSRHRDQLQGRYLFLLPDPALTERILDKSSQLHLMEEIGIEVPATHEVHSEESLAAARALIGYPALLKGVRGHEWKRYTASKGFRVRDEQELVARSRDLLSQNIRVIIQEIIPGTCQNNYEVSVYAGPAGGVTASLTIQKLRQCPPDFGFGSMTVSTRNEAVEALANRIVAALGWRGFANIEFKRDPATGRYTFIELNPRVWQQVGQAEKLGMNFPLHYYRDLTGGRSEPCGPYRLGVKWMDLRSDVATSLKMIVRGELSVPAWLASLRGVNCLGLFALDDPLPFVRSIRHRDAVRKLWRLVRGSGGAP